MNPFSFKFIDTSNEILPQIISLSMGNPTEEKIKKVLKNYLMKNHYLLGYFFESNLIAVIGVFVDQSSAIIKHISVLEKFRKKGIGKKLIQYIIKKFSLQILEAETDDDAVLFYQSLGFKCTSIDSNHELKRYICRYSK